MFSRFRLLVFALPIFLHQLSFTYWQKYIIKNGDLYDELFAYQYKCPYSYYDDTTGKLCGKYALNEEYKDFYSFCHLVKTSPSAVCGGCYNKESPEVSDLVGAISETYHSVEFHYNIFARKFKVPYFLWFVLGFPGGLSVTFCDSLLCASCCLRFAYSCTSQHGRMGKNISNYFRLHSSFARQ